MGKPITDNMKTRCNRAYLCLKHEATNVSKEELMRVLGLNNERSVRDVISTLAKRVSIISTSDEKGYSLYRKGENDKELKHTFCEHMSRNRELCERDIPIAKDLGIGELFQTYVDTLDRILMLVNTVKKSS